MSTYVLPNSSKHLVLSLLTGDWQSSYAVLPQVQVKQCGQLSMSHVLLVRHLKALESLGYVDSANCGKAWRINQVGSILLKGLGKWKPSSGPITPHGELIRKQWDSRRRGHNCEGGVP